MTKDFKSLVQQIQKMAAPPPAPPQGWSPVSTKTSPGGAPSGGSVRQGNPAIKKMQEVLTALAKDVTGEINVGQGGERAAGRDSFADFLARRFMRNSAVPAVEFTQDPNKVNPNEKDPRAASKMSWVMDTMSRIGHNKVGQEPFADGFWGPKTTAALQNMYALTTGLFAMADAMDVRPQGYTEENLEQLKAGVENGNELDEKTKEEYAPKITNHLVAIRRMFNQLKQDVMNLPKYKSIIEGQEAYQTYSKSGPALTQQQYQSMNNTFKDGWVIQLGSSGGPQSANVSAQIKLENIMNPKTLQEWIRSRGANVSPREILDQISQQVTQEMNAASGQEATQEAANQLQGAPPAKGA